MSVLLAVVWFLLAAILGAVGFVLAPLIGGLIGGDALTDWAGQYYLDLAMTTVQDAALVVRETGVLTIQKVSWNPKIQGDQATIDGVTGHWQDPLNVKSTLRGKPFGVGLESASAYVSPLAAEIGHVAKRKQDDGELGVIGGNVDKVKLNFSLPAAPQLTDLREASKMLKGSCKRRWGALAYEWGKISQEKFHERLSTSETLILIGSFAAGVGMSFLLVKYGGGAAAGGGGSVVPI